MSDSTAQSPYATPASDLQAPSAAAEAAPSVEQALKRGYNFSISLLISEAWVMVKGTKGMIFGAHLVLVLAVLITSLIASMLARLSLGPFSDNILLAFIAPQLMSMFLTTLVTTPIMAGLWMIGIRRVAGQPFSFSEVFRHFHKLLPLFAVAIVFPLLTVIMLLLSGITLGLIFIPFVYLSVSYILAIPLVVERGLSPWQALETSRRAVTQHWFKVFGLLLALVAMVLISYLTLGILLIWSIPLLILSLAVLYRTIFGVLPVAH